MYMKLGSTLTWLFSLIYVSSDLEWKPWTFYISFFITCSLNGAVKAGVGFFFQLYKKFLETKSFAELKKFIPIVLFLSSILSSCQDLKCSFPFGFWWPGKNFFVNPRDVMELAQEKINLLGSMSGVEVRRACRVRRHQSPQSPCSNAGLPSTWLLDSSRARYPLSRRALLLCHREKC